MKIEKISCPVIDGKIDSNKCHDDLKLANPNLLSILHEPNNHLLIDDIDYDNKGHVKGANIKKTELNKMDSNFKTKFDVIAAKEFV